MILFVLLLKTYVMIIISFSTSKSDEMRSSKDTLFDAIQKIIHESQEINKVAREVAEGCTEQGLKKVRPLL